MNPVLVGLLAAWFNTRKPKLIAAAAPLFVQHCTDRRGNVRTATDVILKAVEVYGLKGESIIGYGVTGALREALLASNRRDRRKHLRKASERFDAFIRAPQEEP